MNTEKVFIAFNKNGEEILLYRKDDDTYIDLNSDNNEIYNKENIDLTSLSLIATTIDLRKHMLKCCIKRKYKKDRSKMLETKSFLIGLKVKVINYKNWYTGNNLYNLTQHHTWQYEQDSYNLYKYKDNKKVSFNTNIKLYSNLYNEEYYGWELENEPEKITRISDFKNGKEFVIIKDNLFNFTEKSFLDKKEISEIGYKLRKNLINRR